MHLAIHYNITKCAGIDIDNSSHLHEQIVEISVHNQTPHLIGYLTSCQFRSLQPSYQTDVKR